MAIVLPHGVLFRGSSEGTIRETLLKNGSIYAVIGLPSNMFYNTSIPTCIIVLKKHREGRDVLFIDASVERTGLVVYITHAILGNPGKVMLAIIVALACLTTAIGLTSSCGNYFRDLSNGKIKYEVTVAVVSVFSAVVSVFGVDQIIKVAAPILGMLYPAVVVYIFLGLANDKIKNNNIFKFTVWVALILGILSVLPGLPGLNKVALLNNIAVSMTKWPGARFGFFWLVPVVIAGLVGKFVPNKEK